MKCNQCGYDNERDANFCRQCGSELTFAKPDVTKKGKVEFVSGAQRTRVEDTLCFGQEEGRDAGWIIGAVFIIIGLIIVLVMFFPVGEFFGNFGEFFGQLGNDIGNFFGNWGSSFGESVGNFFNTLFSESNIWNIIKVLIPGIFIIVGIIVIIANLRRK
ncbi:MAG: zinc-ribbon domain-containing protein [Candidatus Hodarchaeota archaeon]